MSITVKSGAFADEAAIPVRFTADGDNVSPPLAWEGVPPQTKELALIVEDTDAPSAEPFVHWVVYKIPPAAPQLAEGIAPQRKLKSPAGALQGRNSFGGTGYGGPSPPRGHGVHHYHFHLYALDRPLQVEPGLDHKALLASMAGHILDEGEVVGTYRR